SCRDAVPILVADPPGVSARYTMYDTTSGSGFWVQVSSTSPLPPPVSAISPTTCRGAGFGAEVDVLVGAGDDVDGEGDNVEPEGVDDGVALLEPPGAPFGLEWSVHAASDSATTSSIDDAARRVVRIDMRR